jgi:hypothetical protein
MGDLCRWLLDNGDDCYILASTFDALGEAVLHGQCGVPLDRVIYYNTGNGFYCDHIQDFFHEHLVKLGCDLVDVQWFPGYDVVPFPCKAVATMHGVTSAPPPSIFSGIIAVEAGLGFPAAWKHYATVMNWVNLHRFPFLEKLGEGLCFGGRAFKNINVRKVLPFYQGAIDGYGTSNAPQMNMPPNWRWHGFADLAQVFPKYRIVFGSAQVAMEAIAAGRLVIAGQSLHLPAGAMGGLVPEGCLVTPANIEQQALEHSFGYRHGKEPTAEEVWAEVQKALANDFTEERKAMRGWIEERHSMDVQCGRIRNFYEEVLNG